MMSAEEFEEKYCNDYDSFSDMMHDYAILFARFHVTAALVEINKIVESEFLANNHINEVKNKIFNAYPLNQNIK